ncbi:MAG: HNH endonuclease [Phycisphaerae bacterium]
MQASGTAVPRFTKFNPVTRLRPLASRRKSRGYTTTTLRLKIPNCIDRLFAWPVLFYRRCKYGYTFRRIYLGEGVWTLVSPGDYYELSNYNWYISGNGKGFYAFTNIKIAPGKSKMQSMHRFIMQFELEAAGRKLNPVPCPLYPKLVVDHINNDPLDNRRANLRIATRAQNACNRQKIRTEKSSQYIGVYFEKRTGRYTVKIRIKGKRLWLGRFTDELTAARAYDTAAKKHHGEFAKLNFE